MSTFERQLRLSNLETKLESHVQRRGSGYNGQRMLNTELPDRRKRRPQRRPVEVFTQDIQSVGVTEGDVRGRVK